MDKQDQYSQGTVSNGIKNSLCTKVPPRYHPSVHQTVLCDCVFFRYLLFHDYSGKPAELLIGWSN